MEGALEQTVLNHLVLNQYEVSERSDGFEIIGRKGTIGMVLEDVTDESLTVRFFGVNGRKINARVCMTLNPVFPGSATMGEDLESKCKCRFLAMVKQTVGIGKLRKKKSKPCLKWFRSVGLRNRGCSGCHQHEGFVSCTDGYQVVWTEDDGSKFGDVCDNSKCGVGRKIAKWRKAWSVKSFAVDVKEFVSCLKAMKAVYSQVKLHVKFRSEYMIVETENFLGETGKWSVKLAKKWSGKSLSNNFLVSYLVRYVNSTKTLTIFPDLFDEAWGFKGDVYMSALIPVADR